MDKKQKKNSRSGFTLIEIMLVLMIIVAISSVGVVLYRGIQDRANLNVTKTRIQELAKAIELYRMNVGVYPSADEGLQALCVCPSGISNPDKWMKVMDSVPVDPWDSPFQYQYPSNRSEDGFDVWSCGPDQINGSDDDVSNWKK